MLPGQKGNNDPGTGDQRSPCLLHASNWKQASEWSLVLTACRIPHEVSHSAAGYIMEVDSDLCQQAILEIQAYEHENRNWPPPPAVPHQESSTEKNAWIILILAAAMGATLSPEFHQAGEAGAAWAGKIMQGQWWRAATALTLHTGPSHLLGNMLIGGFIMVHACNYMGSGLAWFLTVISGVAGNLMNAAIQPASHISVGSSTAVFGLIGSVTAFRAAHDRSAGIRRFALPLGAGIALLGFTGSAGEHTDLGAHACGFIAGIVSGAVAGLAVQAKGLPDRKTDRMLGAVALMIPVMAWFAVWM